MQCEDVGTQLASVVDGTSTLDRRAARHAAGCLRCQAELANYRRLRRTLRHLAFEPVAVPAGLSEAVIARLDGAPTALGGRAANPWTRRAAYAGALAATAAGAAGALALVSSRRRGRGALSGLGALGA